MEKLKVIISNRQKQVKIPTGVRMLIRRCCHAVLLLEHFQTPLKSASPLWITSRSGR